MVGSPLTNVRNGFLSAEPVDSITTGPNRRRSTSVTPSERSSRSRITLVETDPDLASDHGQKIDDSYKVITIFPPKYSWLDHFLGVFCIDITKKKKPIMREEFVKPAVRDVPEVDGGSPWILPVYVLSTRKNTDKNHVPVEAMCTIDTGNMQGNIVSRKFVEDVLQYSESNFSELTTDEKKGGTGITGHTLIPDGAIYLTWYHQKSTRVFRNMRFLISPNPRCDLVIGARSILKDNLLDVPNLMADSGGRITIDGQTHIDEDRQPLYQAWYELDDKVKTLERSKKQSNDATEQALIDKKLAVPKQKLAIATLELEIYDAEKNERMDPAKRREIIDGLRKKLEGLPGYVKPTVKEDLPLEKIIPSSVPVTPETIANQSRKRKAFSWTSRKAE